LYSKVIALSFSCSLPSLAIILMEHNLRSRNTNFHKRNSCYHSCRARDICLQQARWGWIEEVCFNCTNLHRSADLVWSDLQHKLVLGVFNDSLLHPIIPTSGIRSIADVGTGTGRVQTSISTRMSYRKVLGSG